MQSKKYILLTGALAVFVYCLTWFVTNLADVFFDLNNQGDALSYLEASKNLIHKGEIHPIRPLGIALLHGIPNVIGLETVDLIRFIVLIQAIVWFSQIFVLFKTLQLVSKDKVAFILTVVYILSLSNIILTSLVLSETWSILFLLLACHFLLKHVLTNESKYLLHTGGFLLLLVIIKPGFYYLAILFTLLLLYLTFKQGFKWRKSLFFAFALILVLFNNFLIWKEYDKFKPSFIDVETMYTYLGAYGHTEIQNTSTARVQRERRAEMDQLSYSEIQQVSKEDIWFQLEYHPFVLLKYLGRNIVSNSSTGNPILHLINEIQKEKLRGTRLFYWLSQCYNMVFSITLVLLPIAISFLKMRWDLFLLSLTLINFYVLITSGISYMQGDRFHLILYPILIIQLAYTLFKWKQKKSLTFK